MRGIIDQKVHEECPESWSGALGIEWGPPPDNFGARPYVPHLHKLYTILLPHLANHQIRVP